MKDGQVPTDHDTGAAELAQDVAHHLVVGGQLVVQPDVLDRHAQLFEQMENEFQFAVGQRLAGDAPVEGGHAHQRFPVEDRNGHLRAEQLELFLHLHIAEGFAPLASDDAALAEEMAADAALEGEFKMFQQAGRQSDGAGRAHAARFRKARRAPEYRGGLAQENHRPVHPKNFPQQ